jgi:hypothetical protein
MTCVLEAAASYGPKSALVLDEPVSKHGSEVAVRLVMASGVVEPDAAGIDVGAEEIYVAVPRDRDQESTRRFSSFSSQSFSHGPLRASRVPDSWANRQP